MIKIKPLIIELSALVQEFAEAKSNIRKVTIELELLDKKYQKGKIDFKTYTQQCNAILSGRTREQINENYSFYIESIKLRIKEVNSKAFKLINLDKSYESLVLDKDAKKRKGNIEPA